MKMTFCVEYALFEGGSCVSCFSKPSVVGGFGFRDRVVSIYLLVAHSFSRAALREV